MDKKPSIKPTQLMSAVSDNTPPWILPIGSLMINRVVREMPTIDDIILEARGLLATRYGWRGREMDVAETIGCNDTIHSSAHINHDWDQYNAVSNEISEQNYLREMRLAPPIA